MTATPPPPLARPIETRMLIETILTAVALGLGGYFLYSALATGETPTARRTQAVALLLLGALAPLVAIYTILIRRYGWSWSDLGYAVGDPRWARLGMLIGFLAVPAMLMLQLMLHGVFQELAADPDAIRRNRETLAAGEHLFVQAAVIILLGGFLVPIAEELFFRGVVYGWLRGKMAARPAGLISAAVFGILHINPETVVAAFVLGLVLALVTERSRSLIPAILIHQTYNTGILMISFFAAWSL